MKPTRVLVFSENTDMGQVLASLLPAGYAIDHFVKLDALRTALQADKNAILILMFSEQHLLEIPEQIQQEVEGHPLLIAMCAQLSVLSVNALLKLQPLALIPYPFEEKLARSLITDALEEAQDLIKHRQLQDGLPEINQRLNQRLQEINTIYTVGKFVAASLNADEVLDRIVGVSINLTQADEGFILLEESGKLYLRITKSMQANVAQSFRVEAADEVAWQVIRSGRPTMLHRDTQVATGRLAHSLLYVPLQVPGRGFVGVLGVVNISQNRPFTENHLFTLSSVADFAAIALENARLFGIVEAEKSRLSAILKHATEAILVTDTANRLLLWSETAAKLFDIQPDAQGEAIEACIKHATLRELFYRADEGEVVLHAEIALENGSVFNTQLSSIEHVGRVVIMQNITHLKELDRLKSEFVSMVSHDLRTPLTTVQGYIELLNRVGPLTDMQTDFIEKALSSLSHIAAIIGDLLDIGRIEAGYDLEMRPIRVDELVQQTTEAYILPAEQADVELCADLPKHPLWLQGDARRIRQVLENLISNAIKYNRPGGWVRVVAEPDGNHIIVRVEDNGIGIPLKEQPKIFERFYRVQTPETEDVQGTGLGLAIVKSVIEKHRGRVWVESVPGAGSIFAFVVPASKPDDT